LNSNFELVGADFNDIRAVISVANGYEPSNVEIEIIWVLVPTKIKTLAHDLGLCSELFSTALYKWFIDNINDCRFAIRLHHINTDKLVEKTLQIINRENE
jgi:hypothetical protein